MHRNVHLDKALDQIAADQAEVSRAARRKHVRDNLVLEDGTATRAALTSTATRTRQGAVALGAASVLLAPQMAGVAQAAETPTDPDAPDVGQPDDDPVRDPDTTPPPIAEQSPPPPQTAPPETAPPETAPPETAPPEQGGEDIDRPDVGQPDDGPTRPGDDAPVDEQPVEEEPVQEPVEEDDDRGGHGIAQGMTPPIDDVVSVVDQVIPVEVADGDTPPAEDDEADPVAEAPVEEPVAQAPTDDPDPTAPDPDPIAGVDDVVQETVTGVVSTPPPADASDGSVEQPAAPTPAEPAAPTAPASPPVANNPPPPSSPPAPVRPQPATPTTPPSGGSSAAQPVTPSPQPVVVQVPTPPAVVAGPSGQQPPAAEPTPSPSGTNTPEPVSAPSVHPLASAQDVDPVAASTAAAAAPGIVPVHPISDAQSAIFAVGDNESDVVESADADVTLEERIAVAQARPVDEQRVLDWTDAVVNAWTNMQAGERDDVDDVIALPDLTETPTLGWSYEVQLGDSLWDISRAVWGTDALSSTQISTTSQVVYTWNADVIGEDPDQLNPGTVIELPLDAGIDG